MRAYVRNAAFFRKPCDIRYKSLHARLKRRKSDIPDIHLIYLIPDIHLMSDIHLIYLISPMS